MAKQQINYAKEMKSANAKKHKKERFITARMWFSTIISKFNPDRETIPKNIGDNLLVLNNMYITKKALSAVIGTFEYTENTPVAFTSELIKYVKDRCADVVIDVKFRNVRTKIDLDDRGLHSRVKMWEMMLDNPMTRPTNARRAARCLYAIDVAKSKEPLYKSRIFVQIRAKRGSILKQATDLAVGYLSSIGAETHVVRSNLQKVLEYCTKISSVNNSDTKDIPCMLMSNETIAEVLPNTQDINDSKGVCFGIDVDLHAPYLIDIRSSANAKNIYVAGDSGSGKTMIVQNYAIDMFLDDYCQAFMDIKGTEFGGITHAMGGISVAMTRSSTEYINCFIWDKEDVSDGLFSDYANEQIRRAKERMLIICNFASGLEATGESLLERFLQSMYVAIGASPDNPNTWFRTKDLTPFIVWDYFKDYLSKEVRVKYGEVAETAEKNLEAYYAPYGSNATMFSKPFRIAEILRSDVICFDFGLIKENGSQTAVQYRLHLEDMRYILDKFLAKKKSDKKWTHLVLEESQIIPGYMGQLYSHYITLGRSMNLVTSMLGNSVSALWEDENLRKGLENINMFLLGKLPSTSRELLVDEFGLTAVDFEKLQLIQRGHDYQHAFLFVNNMQNKSTTSIIRAELPKEAVNSALFKVVDTVDKEQ